MSHSLRVLITGALVILTGCAGQGGMFGPGSFEIKQADTRFTEQKNPVFFSRNNRISSKSNVGGIHIDGSGVFINPTVMKSRDMGMILLLGFSIANMTSHDTAFGSPNTLGVIQKITFLLNGTKPIILPVKNGDVEWGDTVSYNTVTQSASSSIVEQGSAFLSPEQYREIISSESVAVQIQGSKQTATYEAKDISDSFIPNLKDFFHQYVEKGSSLK